ncbi:ArsR/SmtB family transcription factor [Mariniflexile jejuense]|uniref:ArsR/SmtB family transcription factor n=1 Tax=Mariniflexile jejuense TaxID=1173582 RepID=A0ABW3JIR9_9FLAO
MKRDIFQAIADPTRRAILLLIATQALTPNALAQEFHTTRQAVSKHIKILNECELLQQEKVGREIYYSLKVEKMKEVELWIHKFKQFWEDRFDNLDAYLENIQKDKT